MLAPPKKLRRNCRQIMDGIDLLRALGSRDAACVNFDPQYRQILEKMNYGNEGDRQIERAALPQMSDAQITAMMIEIERILSPSAHLLLWTDKFGIVSGHWRRWLPGITSLAPVDMIVWDKMKIGMGRRARCRSEFVIILQKGPLRAEGIWTDHTLADVWPEKADRSKHAHAKPLTLTGRLIAAVTKPGDLVVDPCAGSYGTLMACKTLGREFIGCDLIA